MGFSNPQQNIVQFQLPDGSTVVDLGAGTGAYSIAMAKVIGPSNGKVYAVEVQKEFLSKIQTNASNEGVGNIEVIWGDIEEVEGTKLADNFADAVVVANVLFQIENKDGLVKEANRILKPGGKVLVVDWSDSFGGLGPQPEYVVAEEEAKSLFEKENLSYEKNIVAGEHHFGIIFRKSNKT